MSGEGSSYSGWLGGYAKSVAGSVSAFTQDILEETRAETQDLDSLLKHSYEKTAQCEARIQTLDAEIAKLKSELAEAAEDREVSELQLQEVGNRWRSVVREKDEEIQLMKSRITEVESSVTETPTLDTRTLVVDNIDFSDPFVCELEIGRLVSENISLKSKLDNSSTKSDRNSTIANDEDSEAKIVALQAQLRSVYIEHQNELALKQQETDHLLASLGEGRSESQGGESDNVAMQRKCSDLEQQLNREKGFFKQLEEEKNALELLLAESRVTISSLSEDNVRLSDQVAESADNLRRCEQRVAEMENRGDVPDAETTTAAQYSSVISNLNLELGRKTSETKSLRSELLSMGNVLSNKDKEIGQLRIALDTVKSEDFQELRGVVDSLKIQVDGYKDSLKETGHQLLQAHNQLDKVSNDRAELQSRVQCLGEEKERREDEVKEALIQVKAKEDFITELQETCSTQRKRLTELEESFATVTSQHEAAVRVTNQLKAEKVELVVESKELRDDLASAVEESRHLTTELSRLREHPLFYILLEDLALTQGQMLEIRDIISVGGEEKGEEESEEKGEVREVRRKLADKSEQLKIMQGTISKLRTEQADMMSVFDHDDVITRMTSQHRQEVEVLEDCVNEMRAQIRVLVEEKQAKEELLDEIRASQTKLESEIAELRAETEDRSQNSELEEFKLTAEKEKKRLLEEIERLVEEASEVEEVYALAVSEKEALMDDATSLRVALEQKERDALEQERKMGKVTESLKKAQSRLTVKDAKIDELSDQLVAMETKLMESSELVKFYKSNQTDECKAAQLGLSELTSVQPPVSGEPSKYSTRDTPRDCSHDNTCDTPPSDAVTELSRLRQDLMDADARYEKLLETCRDKELRIEFLEAEAATELSHEEVDTTKLIDRNMLLQKSNSELERELAGVKSQNIELVHQRDFYQDQAKDFHDNMEQLRSEANKLITEANERAAKSATELERLQDHLVKTEQSHAEDFLSATQSEQDLRSDIAQLRDKVLSLNQTLDTTRAENAQEVTMMTTQLHVACAQRDEALDKMTSLESEAAVYQTSLTNLQIALEQFQQDREGYASEVEDQYKRNIDIMKEQLGVAESEKTALQARISEMQLIEEDFKSFKEDSKSKDDRIQCLQREVSKLDVALKVAQEGLQKVRCTSEDKVERSLMKTFFTQYITAPDSRKPEVLRLMTSILNYSDEEMEALHRSRDKKWLSGIFPTSVAGAVSGVPPPTADIQPGQSFSELFVSFLETEANRGSVMGSRPLSSPPPSLRAPATGPHHQRSPSSSVSFHQRSPSSTSTTSNNSLPVSLSTTTKESCPLAEMGPQSDPAILTPGAPSLQALHTSPLVVPASLADLLSKR